MSLWSDRLSFQQYGLCAKILSKCDPHKRNIWSSLSILHGVCLKKKKAEGSSSKADIFNFVLNVDKNGILKHR